MYHGEKGERGEKLIMKVREERSSEDLQTTPGYVKLTWSKALMGANR